MISFVEGIDDRGRLVNPVYPSVFGGVPLWAVQGGFKFHEYIEFNDVAEIDVVLPIEV